MQLLKLKISDLAQVISAFSELGGSGELIYLMNLRQLEVAELPTVLDPTVVPVTGGPPINLK